MDILWFAVGVVGGTVIGNLLIAHITNPRRK